LKTVNLLAGNPLKAKAFENHDRVSTGRDGNKERTWFFRFPGAANEMAVEPLSHPRSIFGGQRAIQQG
jgi:hypothetical protein